MKSALRMGQHGTRDFPTHERLIEILDATADRGQTTRMAVILKHCHPRPNQILLKNRLIATQDQHLCQEAMMVL